jgi:hypothetical protein
MLRRVPPYEACGGATPAFRNACLPTGRHFGVQARAFARRTPLSLEVLFNSWIDFMGRL